MPIRQWVKSANFAIEGVLHAAKTQRHLRYHFYAAAGVLFVSYVLGVSKNEFLIIALAVIAVLVAEMLNSSIEAMVDILCPEIATKAREAKDIAAGAVLITAFGALVVGYIVLFPYIRDFFVHPYITKHSIEEVSVVAFILVLITVVLMKAYFHTGHPLSGGMPSGHSALAFSVWVSVSFATRSAFVSLACLALALVVAQSRISAGVHSYREVVVGALVGTGVTLGLFWVFT